MSRKQPFFGAGYERLRAFFGKGAIPSASQPSARHVVAVATADPVQSEFENAFSLHQQGKLDEAKALYSAVLRLQPMHADTLHLLGVVEAQRNNLTEAATLIERAIEASPENAAAHSNYGNVLRGLKRDEAALTSYDRALALNPDLAETLNSRGVVLGSLGRHDAALASYERALAINTVYVDALLNQGASLAALNRHRDALLSFERALEISAHHAEALLGRGIALSALGRYLEALATFDRSLEIKPTSTELLSHRGSVLVALSRYDEALASFERVLAINPNHADAMSNCGGVLVALGRNEEALMCYDCALATKPDSLDALLKRAATLIALRRYTDALDSCDRALAINPAAIEAWFNRGFALTELKQYAHALVSYEKVLLIRPDFAEALHNRAMVLTRVRRYEEALTGYDKAIAVRPDYAEAHSNRGAALMSLNRHSEAVASINRAVAFNPNYPEALCNLGVAQGELKRYEEALVSYDRALEIRPGFLDALNNRGGIFRKLGLHERAVQDYSRLLELDPEYEHAVGNKCYSNLWVCNWRQYDADQTRLFEAVRDGKRAGLPFQIVVMSDSGADQLRYAQTYAAHKYPAATAALWTGDRYRHDRIRIAYLSADFHAHATAYLMAELFEKHDKRRFDVSAWSFGPDANDEMRERLTSSFEQFNNVRSESDLAVATLLRTQEIDIAIDLKGYTERCRPAIFAHRPAPVQVNYLGYPGTMGADYMDYIIGDANVIPAGSEPSYAEKVVRLPDTYQVNDSKRVISERAPSRADAGLPKSGFVFCCFNNNYKITPSVFDIWMRLLKRVDGSVLWLLADNPAATRNLRSEAESRGVAPDRLVFAKRMPLSDHLARHGLADLFLDTLPCNAHTTASDALWGGLPVLTCRGNAFAGRVAASLLSAIGLPELITENVADYEALALKLATTPVMLNELKAKLARNRATHPLFDIDRFTRHIESAYVMMYERYQRGELPQSFTVKPVQSPEVG